MARGKTEFRFTVNVAPEVVNQVFLNYLSANGFKHQEKPNANYYCINDPIVKGKRALEFYMNGNEVIVFAYLGTFEKPGILEGFVGAIPKQAYKNDLAPLFEELHRLNTASNTAYAQPNANPAMPQNDGLNQFVEQNDKRKETWTIVGFVMSLIGVVMSFFGLTYGLILLVLEFYLGIQGLQAKRYKGLAITTIVLGCVSLLLLVLQIVFLIVL